MKTLINLSLLSLGLLASSCNEKVSPELLEANATTAPTNNNIIQPQSSYSFSVKNTSNLMLGYQLHKTGYGNASKGCEISSTLKFGTEAYQYNRSTYDITCFFEAEELAMFFNGFEFSIESSPNSCDYIGYQPFGFFERIPGNSSGTYTKVDCANDVTTDSIVASELRNSFLIDPNGLASDVNNRNPGFENWFSASNNPLKCNEYMSTDSNLREAFTAENDKELCRFIHKDQDKEINCDIGEIDLTEMKVTHTVATDNALATTKTEIVKRKVVCGGKVSNCVQGPVKKLNNKKITDSVNIVELLSVTTNSAFNRKYTYGALYEGSSSVMQYANYRRNLANKDIEFDDATGGALNDTYIDAFTPTDIGETIQHTFQPEVMELYAMNRRQDRITPILSSNEVNSYAIDRYRPYKAMPYAADPYMGLSGYNVNPFYTFFCFDKAYDVKARIRMVVREWDRIFPASSSELEYLSDIWAGEDSKQDSAVEDEISDEPFGFFKYNDIVDWDDRIPMMRSPGTFSLSGTLWMPAGSIDPLTGLHSGWFNPLYFPQNNY